MALKDEGKEALDWIMNEGHFDEIRKKIVDSLRHNDELRDFTMQQLDESRTLCGADVDDSNRKKLLDDLRKELEDTLLDKACKTAWELMNDSENDIGGLIDKKVRDALCTIYENRAKQDAQASTGPSL